MSSAPHLHGSKLGRGLGRVTTRSISAENPTGAKGGASMTEGTGKNCARDLGPGWKISPSGLMTHSTSHSMSHVPRVHGHGLDTVARPSRPTRPAWKHSGGVLGLVRAGIDPARLLESPATHGEEPCADHGDQSP